MSNKQKIDENNEDMNLTFANLTLKWWINKVKNDPDMDYSARVQFARFKLERVSGQKVKMNNRRT